MEISSRGRKTICLPIDSPEQYQAIVEDLEGFRSYVDEVIKSCPELLPPEIILGYRFYGTNYSKKQNLKIRRIQLLSSREVYQIRPEFVMPYMIGMTDEVEKALFLRRYGVPYDALVYVFGRHAMYWYRAEHSLGKFSLVGTTIKDPEKMSVKPEQIESEKAREKIQKLTSKSRQFQVAYDFPQGYRTSNALDRLMNYQDSYIYAMKYFHGNIQSACIQMRAMALIWNFHPYGQRTKQAHPERYSPFAELNGFVYHENWLHNLLIAGSMNGYIPRN